MVKRRCTGDDAARRTFCEGGDRALSATLDPVAASSSTTQGATRTGGVIWRWRRATGMAVAIRCWHGVLTNVRSLMSQVHPKISGTGMRTPKRSSLRVQDPDPLRLRGKRRTTAEEIGRIGSCLHPVSCSRLATAVWGIGKQYVLVVSAGERHRGVGQFRC